MDTQTKSMKTTRLTTQLCVQQSLLVLTHPDHTASNMSASAPSLPRPAANPCSAGSLKPKTDSILDESASRTIPSVIPKER